MSGIMSSFIQPFPLEKTYGQTTSATWLKHRVSTSISFQSLCVSKNVPRLMLEESMSLVVSPTTMGDTIFLQENPFPGRTV